MLVCDCGTIDHFTIVDPPTWWDELVDAAEWPQDEQRDAKLLAWASQYADEILDAATDSFIAESSDGKEPIRRPQARLDDLREE